MSVTSRPSPRPLNSAPPKSNLLHRPFARHPSGFAPFTSRHPLFRHHPRDRSRQPTQTFAVHLINSIGLAPVWRRLFCFLADPTLQASSRRRRDASSAWAFSSSSIRAAQARHCGARSGRSASRRSARCSSSTTPPATTRVAIGRQGLRLKFFPQPPPHRSPGA